MPKILLIDDEPVIQHAFRKAFHPPEYETVTARTAAEALALLAGAAPDAIILDVHLPDADGLTAFDRIQGIDPRTPIILITGHGTTDLAIEAMKRGAFDYVLKPLHYDALQALVGRACESSRLMKVPSPLGGVPAAGEPSDALLGRCPAMQEVYKQVGRVAATDATVLILGESGTGKELVARAVYQHGRRAGKPFLAVNCGAIPESLVESELFGHEKGAFTSADRRRIGKFEQCHGGTLFLDEVGELPPAAQVKMLRVLQERTFERVGGTETVRSDVRIIAATNADLEAEVADGGFRSDLFFRLNVFSIKLPPLRDRGDDLDLLLDHFVARFAAEFGRSVAAVPADTRAVLRAYPWPGNVRELQSVLKQALLTMSGGVLLRDYLPIGKPRPEASGPADGRGEGRSPADWDRLIAAHQARGSTDLYAECVAAMERQLFTNVLRATAGNQLRAAELLGITRGTLRVKLKALGIVVERTVSSETAQAD